MDHHGWLIQGAVGVASPQTLDISALFPSVAHGAPCASQLVLKSEEYYKWKNLIIEHFYFIL